MSEEVIARIEAPRAAPMLVGHADARAALLAGLDSGRLAHGWLITGPEGIGKATLAWWFVRVLFGGDRAGEGVAQGGARQVAAGTHPDVRLVRRTYNPRPPHRFRQVIAVDDIRALGGFLHQTAALGGWRAIIVDAADEMNANAANALLKLLEEPPPATVLLLVSHAPGRLLPTLRSRCRHVALHPLAEEEVAEVLARRGIADAESLARIAGGSPGRALLLHESGGLAVQAELQALMADLPALDTERLHALADRLAGAKGELAFRAFAILLEDALAAALRRAATLRSDATLRAATEGGPAGHVDNWLEVWDKAARLIAGAGRVNLDRRQVVLAVFFAMAEAAGASGPPGSRPPRRSES